jgi:hypothetical protein
MNCDLLLPHLSTVSIVSHTPSPSAAAAANMIG